MPRRPKHTEKRVARRRKQDRERKRQNRMKETTEETELRRSREREYKRRRIAAESPETAECRRAAQRENTARYRAQKRRADTEHGRQGQGTEPRRVRRTAKPRAAKSWRCAVRQQDQWMQSIDADSPFPVVWEVLNGEEAETLLWRRPISPSSSSADEEEEEDSLPAPFTPAMDQDQQTVLAETVVYIKEEPEDFEFEGCGDIPLPSQPGQNHIKTDTSASQPQKRYPTQTRTYRPARIPEFTCNFCEKTFLKSYKLLEHQKKCKPRHVPPKEFTCNTCGRRFERASSLRNHLKHHSGEKPYSCSFCGKQFVFDKSCRTHERRDHVAMGYRCSDCGETFREREQKDRHKCLVFKGESVFPCSECQDVFSRQYLLKKHQLEFHPEISVETSQSPRTEMDRTNPADTVEKNMEEMEERREEEEELFDPGELVPPSLALLGMEEMVQPVDYIFGSPANIDKYVENTNHDSALNSDHMDNLKHGSPAEAGVCEFTSSGLTAGEDRSRDSSNSESTLQDD